MVEAHKLREIAEELAIRGWDTYGKDGEALLHRAVAMLELYEDMTLGDISEAEAEVRFRGLILGKESDR